MYAKVQGSPAGLGFGKWLGVAGSLREQAVSSVH